MWDECYKMKLIRTPYTLSIPYRVGIGMVSFPESLRGHSMLPANYKTDFSDDPNNSRSSLSAAGGGMDEETARKVVEMYVRHNFDRKHYPRTYKHRKPVEVRIMGLLPRVKRGMPWKIDEHAPLNAIFAEGVVYHIPTDWE